MRSEPVESESLTESEKRLLVGLAGAVLVVLLIIVAVNVFSGGDDGDGDAAAPPDTPVTESGPAADAFGEGGGIVDTPTAMAPTSDAVVDSFERDALGGGPLRWSILSEGDWDVAPGTMTVAGVPETAAPLAVAEVPEDLEGDWTFSVTINSPATGMGLVWGVEDAQNYWELRANLDYAALVINHVKDGAPQQVKIIGPAGLSPGQRLSVQREGDTVTLASNEEPFFSLKDPSLADARTVGVVANSGSGVSYGAAAISKVDGSG
ncbi:MAG: hypothetical protein R2754_03210 [Microthrixaceae bacterium]